MLLGDRKLKSSGLTHLLSQYDEEPGHAIDAPHGKMTLDSEWSLHVLVLSFYSAYLEDHCVKRGQATARALLSPSFVPIYTAGGSTFDQADRGSNDECGAATSSRLARPETVVESEQDAIGPWREGGRGRMNFMQK